jgi:hypothetical protein
MRHAVKSNNSKLFSPKQYLTKNQIRSLFGRLSKKGVREQKAQWIQNREKDTASASSDEDNAEDYFRTQQNEELEDLKADEVDNALNCCSDVEDDMDQMDEN